VTAAVCPVCYGRSDDGTLCQSCTDDFTTDLRGNRVVMGVAELVDNLHVAQAKQARMDGGGHGDTRKGDIKHERMPLQLGAMDAVRGLEFYLGSWARDLTGDKWRPNLRGRRSFRAEGGPPGPFCPLCGHESCRVRRAYQTVPGIDRYVAVQAADVLLAYMGDIRRHGAVSELIDEVGKALKAGRNAIDVEPLTRFPVGPCPEDGCGRTVFAVCPAEGSKKPALMACYLIVKGENRPNLGAGLAHSWTSIQFFRTGERIRRKMERQQMTEGAA
jgi:hypothetical protein